MNVYRISSQKYSKKLNASGKSNRWNRDGQFVIYTSESRSLSTLEMLVHRSKINPNITYDLMVISIVDEDDLFEEISIKSLPENWRTLAAYDDLQSIGSEWYEEKRSLVLKIPSVIIPQESNLMINTEHPDFTKKVKLLKNEPFVFDPRITAEKN